MRTKIAGMTEYNAYSAFGEVEEWRGEGKLPRRSTPSSLYRTFRFPDFGSSPQPAPATDAISGFGAVFLGKRALLSLETPPPFRPGCSMRAAGWLLRLSGWPSSGAGCPMRRSWTRVRLPGCSIRGAGWSRRRAGRRPISASGHPGPFREHPAASRAHPGGAGGHPATAGGHPEVSITPPGIGKP